MACLDLTPSRALFVILLIIIIGMAIWIVCIEVQASRELEQSKNIALVDFYRNQIIIEQNKISLNQTRAK